MARFIETDAGWINLDHVETISEPATAPGKLARAALLAPDGRLLGRTREFVPLDPNQVGATYVAAPAGSAAVVVSRFQGEDRPVEADVYAIKQPVAAWKIEFGIAQPVFFESSGVNDIVLIYCPDGRLMDPENCIYDDLEAAKASILEQAQHEWDRKRQQTAA